MDVGNEIPKPKPQTVIAGNNPKVIDEITNFFKNRGKNLKNVPMTGLWVELANEAEKMQKEEEKKKTQG